MSKNATIRLFPHNSLGRFEGAAEFPIGETISCSLLDKDDLLIYKIVPHQNGVYRIHTMGDVDTEGYLYDSNYNVIAKNDFTSKLGLYELANNFCKVDINFGLTYYMEQGEEYYIGVASGDGWYDSDELGTFSLEIYRYGDWPSSTSGYEIVYEPSKWNDTPSIYSGNCYSYATNYSGLTIPGKLWNQKILTDNDPSNDSEVVDIEESLYAIYDIENRYYELKSPEEVGAIVVNAATLDAETMGGCFIPVEENEVCPPGTYKVALVLSLIYSECGKDALVDFHWYRQNQDGSWSHKPGGAIVRDWDNTRVPIYYPTPDMADTWDYNCFVGYFAVKDGSRYKLYSINENDTTDIRTDITRDENDLIDISEFDFLELNMYKEDIISQLGYPHQYMGSGFSYEVYNTITGEKFMLRYDTNNILQAVLKQDMKGYEVRIK